MVELKQVVDRWGRRFVVGRMDRSRLRVGRIFRVGNYVTVCFVGVPGKGRYILLHVADVSDLDVGTKEIRYA